MQNQAMIKKRLSWKSAKKEGVALGKGLFFLMFFWIIIPIKLLKKRK